MTETRVAQRHTTAVISKSTNIQRAEGYEVQNSASGCFDFGAKVCMMILIFLFFETMELSNLLTYTNHRKR